MSLSIYGKLPSGERLKKIQVSPNYKKGSFKNISKTNALVEEASFCELMKGFFIKPKIVFPAPFFPFIKTELKKLNSPEPAVIWFGHSSYLVKINNKTILVDPV